jgi:hypothetical protein
MERHHGDSRGSQLTVPARVCSPCSGFDDMPCVANYCPVISRIRLAQGDIVHQAGPGLGRTVALHDRSSASYHIH